MFGRISAIARHRELILRLAVKDLKVRYKSPWLGFMWTLLVPIFMMLILTAVFTWFFKVEVDPYPFPLFLIAALFPWSFLSLSLSAATTNIVESGGLIKKVYFPREVIPVAVVVANLINFVLALLILLVVFLVLPIRVSGLVALLPLLIVLQALFVAGMSLILSSLQVHYRDVKYIVEILLLGWFYVSPIIYPVQKVVDFIAEKGASRIFLHLYLLNPMAGFAILFRGAFLPGYLEFLPEGVDYWRILLQSAAWVLVALVGGLAVFRRLESGFADLT